MAEAIGQMSPEEFKKWAKATSEADIKAQVQAAGTEQTLDGLFKSMQESFLPERAKGVDVAIQYLINEDGKEYPYCLTIKSETCTLTKEAVAAPKITIRIDVVSFLKLAGQAADGMQLYMSGKLKIGGDMMFAQRMAGFFKSA